MREPTDWLPSSKVISFFTPEECRHVIALADASDMHDIMGPIDDGTTFIGRDHHRCYTGQFKPGSEIYRIVAERTLECLPEINHRYNFELFEDLHELLPVVNINRYNGGAEGRIRMHTDIGHFKCSENRKLTLSVLMTPPSDFQGGLLRVFDGVTHYPLDGQPIGSAAVYPGFTVHGVESVHTGIRYSAVFWLRGPKFC